MPLRDSRHRQAGGWASNPNVAVYIFVGLFIAWLGFQIWAGMGGPHPPATLDPMVMAALGVAISAKSVERKQQETELKDRVTQSEDNATELKGRVTKSEGKVSALEDVAKESHPEVVAEHSPPLEDGPDD